MAAADEREWQTRKQRIDPRLDASGWPAAAATPLRTPYRTAEEPTANGARDRSA